MHFDHPTWAGSRLVALGPGGQYVALFGDGHIAVSGPEDLLHLLTENQNRVSRISLGAWGTWCVSFNNGEQAWAGEIPKEMSDLLQPRPLGQPRATYVDIGPDGQWFVMLEDGRWRGRMSERCLSEVKRLREEDASIQRIQFGDNGAFYIVYIHLP